MKDSYVYDSDELFKDNLKQAINHSIPDIFEEIYNDCINEDREEKIFNESEIKNKTNINDKTKKSIYKGLSVMAAMFAIIITICMFNNIRQQKVVKSVVMLDVNPSISLSVNKNDKVIMAKGINDDGKEVLKEINIDKLDIETALDRIIHSMINKGYMSSEDSTILLTIDNKDIKDGRRLEQKAIKNVNEILKVNHISANLIAQIYTPSSDVKSMAKNYKISEGKANIIKRLTKQNILDYEGNVISEEVLAKFNMDEIKTIINNNDINITDVLSNDTVKEGTYVDNSEVVNDKSGVDKENSVKEYILDSDVKEVNVAQNDDEEISADNKEQEKNKVLGNESLSNIKNKLTSIKVTSKKDNITINDSVKVKDTLSKDKKNEIVIISGVANMESNTDNDIKEDQNITDNKNNNIEADIDDNVDIEESLDSINKSESIGGYVQINKNEHINNGNQFNKEKVIDANN